MNREQTITQSQSTQDTAYLDLFFKLTLTALIAFAIGWSLTIVSAIAVNYYDIPTMGEIRVNSEGREYFHHFYPDFRRYAVKTAETPLVPELTKFDQMGYLGTGLYIYSISNAFHWILELKISNFGVILLFPFISMIATMILAYLKWVPKQFQKAQLLVPMALGLSALHTIVLLIFLGSFAYFVPSFASVYDSQFVYSGQILGTAFPSAFIILSTNLFYGAVAGALLQMTVAIGLLPESKHNTK